MGTQKLYETCVLEGFKFPKEVVGSINIIHAYQGLMSRGNDDFRKSYRALRLVYDLITKEL